MDDYERELTERIRASYLRHYWKDSLSQDEKDKLTACANMIGREMARLIAVGKKRREKEEQFRRALGMRLKTPKRGTV